MHSKVPFLAADGLEREALVTLPEGRGPRAAVLLIHGLASPRPPAISVEHLLCVALAERGFGAVHYLPRIASVPPGEAEEVDWEMELADAQGALSLTRNLPRVDGDRVFVFGISLGGIAAPIVAGRDGGARGVASWASTARPWVEYMADNIRVQLSFSGQGTERIEERVRCVEKWFTLLATTEESGEALIETIPKATRYCISAEGYYGRSVSFWRQIVRTDPRAGYAGLDCPVLVVRGSVDCACHPEDFHSVLDAAREAGLEAHGVVLDGIDHNLKPCLDPEASFRGQCAGEPDSGALADVFLEWASRL